MIEIQILYKIEKKNFFVSSKISAVDFIMMGSSGEKEERTSKTFLNFGFWG